MNKALIVEKLDQYIYYSLLLMGISTGVSKAAQNVAIGFGVLIFIIRLCIRHNDLHYPFKSTPFFPKTIIFLLLAAILSVIFSDYPSTGWRTIANLYIARWVFPLILLLSLKTRQQLYHIAVCFLISFTLNNFYCIYEGVIKQLPRSHGIFHAIMSTAGLLCLGVPPLLIGGVLSDNRKKQILLLSAGIVGLAAAYYNHTRGAWLAIGTSVFLCLLISGFRNRRALIAILVTTSIAFGLFFGNSTFHQKVASRDFMKDNERVCLWQSAIAMFRDDPLTGIGFGEFKHVYEPHGYILPEAKSRGYENAHNHTLNYLAEGGLPGVTAILLFWFYLLQLGLKDWHRNNQLISLCFFSMMLSFIIQGQTNCNLITAIEAKSFWIFIALYIKWRTLSLENKVISSVNNKVQ